MSLIKFDKGDYWLVDRRTDRLLRKIGSLGWARRIIKRDYSHIDVDILGPKVWYGAQETWIKGVKR